MDALAELVLLSNEPRNVTLKFITEKKRICSFRVSSSAKLSFLVVTANKRCAAILLAHESFTRSSKNVLQPFCHVVEIEIGSLKIIKPHLRVSNAEARRMEMKGKKKQKMLGLSGKLGYILITSY